MADRRACAQVLRDVSRARYVCSSCLARQRLVAPPWQWMRQYAARPARSTRVKEFQEFLDTHRPEENAERVRVGKVLEDSSLDQRIKLACKSRYLDIESQGVIAAAKLIANGEEKLYDALPDGQKLSLSTMAKAAKVIARGRSQEERRIGAILMNYAMLNEGVDAIIHLAATIFLKKGKMWDSIMMLHKSKVLESLKKSALTDKHPEAMNVLGQIYQLQGRDDDALGLFSGAMARIKSIDDKKVGWGDQSLNLFNTQDVSLIVPVWIVLGNEYLKRKNFAAAAQAYEDGAIRADDPYAYFCASRILRATEGAISPKWLHFVTKAATSGHPQAALMLGDFYGTVDKPKVPILEEDRYYGKESNGTLLKMADDLGLGRILRQQYKYKQLDPFYMEPMQRYSLATDWYFIAAKGGIVRGNLNAFRLQERIEKWDYAKVFLENAMCYDARNFGVDVSPAEEADNERVREEATRLHESCRLQGKF